MKKKFCQETRSRVIKTANFGTLIFILGTTAANAETVYFNDMDRGPANVLQIGGVTVTHTGTGSSSGQPTTVQGVGLGFDNGIGLPGEVDGQAHWPAGQNNADSFLGGDGLDFQVDGDIVSITIMPEMRIFSASGDLMPIPDNMELEFTSSRLLQGGPYPEFSANTSMPITLSVSGGAILASCYLTPQMDWSPDYWFSDYRQSNLAEEQTLQWGFTVISLDYNPVPEPGVANILMLGLFAFLFAGRRIGCNTICFRDQDKWG